MVKCLSHDVIASLTKRCVITVEPTSRLRARRAAAARGVRRAVVVSVLGGESLPELPQVDHVAQQQAELGGEHVALRDRGRGEARRGERM